MHLSDVSWLTPLLALLAAGLVAGFFAGMFGIGGGFVVAPSMLLLLPLLGGQRAEYVHVAVGTSAATIIAASLRSVTAHAQRGAVDFAILRSWAPWLVLGDAAGVLLAQRINGQGLLLIFAVGMLAMSVLFLVPRLTARPISEAMPRGAALFIIATSLGASNALLGIGGGTVAIAVMTLCSRNIHQAIATASGIGVFIAVPTAIGFALIGFGRPGLPWGSLGFVNLPAAVTISSMSVLTAPIGVAVAHSLPAAPLKRIFGAYLVLVSLFMFKNALIG